MVELFNLFVLLVFLVILAALLIRDVIADARYWKRKQEDYRKDREEYERALEAAGINLDDVSVPDDAIVKRYR